MSVTLFARDIPDEAVITFPYAPHEVTVAPVPAWTARKAAGAIAPRMDWTGNGPKKVTISTKQSAAPGDLRLETFLGRLMNWATFPTDLTQAPTQVLMSWGDHVFSGVLTVPVVKKEVMDDRGNALVATLSFALMES
jgi:hypothetical protein